MEGLKATTTLDVGKNKAKHTRAATRLFFERKVLESMFLKSKAELNGKCSIIETKGAVEKNLCGDRTIRKQSVLVIGDRDVI